MLQLTANIMASASRRKIRPTRVFGSLFLQRFCTSTSTARTSAARVKSTVRFCGREQCQYVIPASALMNDAEKVVLSFAIFPRVSLMMIGSRILRPPRMITSLA